MKRPRKKITGRSRIPLPKRSGISDDSVGAESVTIPSAGTPPANGTLTRSAPSERKSKRNADAFRSKDSVGAESVTIPSAGTPPANGTLTRSAPSERKSKRNADAFRSAKNGAESVTIPSAGTPPANGTLTRSAPSERKSKRNADAFRSKDSVGAESVTIPSAAHDSEAELQQLREQLAAIRLELEDAEKSAVDALGELELARDRYAKLYDRSPTAYIVLDRGGFIRDANLTTAAMLGRDRLKLRDTLFSRYVVKEDHRKYLRHLSRCRRSVQGTELTTSLRLVCPDGARFVHLVSTTDHASDQTPSQFRYHTTVVDITKLEQAKQALASSENRYRLLFELNPCPMWICDEKTLAFLDANDAALKLYGYSREAFLLMNAKEIRPTEEVGKFLRAVNGQRKSRATFVGEWRHVKRDGTVFDVHVTISSIADAGREARLVLVNDITERKRSVEALRSKEAQLRLVTGTTSVLLAQCSRDLRYLFVNRACAEFFGLPAEDIVGKPIREIMGDAAFKTILPHVKRVLKGQPVEFETEIPYSHIGKRFMHVLYAPDRDASGEVVGWVATVTDISERKRAEIALRESEARFRIMADAAPVMIWVAGTDKRCTYFNKGWLDFTGRTMQQEVGDGWAEGLHPDDLQRCLDIYVKSSEARKPFEMEYRLRRRDGEYRWILDRGTPRFADHDEFLGYVGSCIDVTERRRMEEELYDAALLPAQNPSPVLRIAADGTLLFSNPAAVALQRRWRCKVGQAAPSNVCSAVLTALKTGQRQELELFSGNRELSFLIAPIKETGYANLYGFDVTARNRAERAVRELEARKTAILESSLDCIVTIDDLGRIITVNPATEKTFGYARHEMIGRKMAELMIPPSLRKRHRKGFAVFLRTGKATILGKRIEMTAMRADGSEFPVELSVSMIRVNGRVMFTAAVRDITERNRAEAALLESRQFLASNLDAMTRLHRLGLLSVREGNLKPVLEEIVDVAIAISGADFGNLQLLDGESGDLKIEAQRGFPKWWLEFWDNVAKGQGACGTALEQGKRVIVEDVKKDPNFANKRMRAIQLKAGVRAAQSTPLVTRSGKILGMFSTHYKTPQRPNERALRLLDLLANQAADLIERTQTIAKLEESEERLRLAQEAGRIGVFDWDLETNHVVWTPQLEDLFGLRRGKFESHYKDWFKHVHPKDVPHLEELFEEWMASDRDEEKWEYRFVRGGQTRWMAARGRLFRDRDGNPFRMIGTNRDVTERKELEAAMLEMNFELEREVNRRTRELRGSNESLRKEMSRRNQLEGEVARVSEMERQRVGRDLHDGLGQQLTAVRLLANAMEHKLKKKALPEAVEASKLGTQIAEAVHQTHDLARGLYPVQLKEDGIVVALQQLAATTKNLFRIRCAFRAPKKRVTLEEETARQLYRIAQEAANNAVKHSRGKNIRIALNQTADGVTLIVSDDGKGFSKSVVTHADMGLSIMQYRANLLGATLSIQGRRGKGTTVTCFLPPPPQ